MRVREAKYLRAGQALTFHLSLPHLCHADSPSASPVVDFGIVSDLDVVVGWNVISHSYCMMSRG